MNSPEFFRQVLGNKVSVKLWDNREIQGTLEAIDGNMNIVLREPSGITFIRGNNVYYFYKETTN